MTETLAHSGTTPKGSGALFFIQIFSTLSFSVLSYTLILYMTKYLHFSDALSTSIMASFAAFNFALHLFGGYIGGRFLSYRVLFCLSMILQGGGCLLISSLTVTSLYWGLAAFLAGSGLNVTCVNCMLTQLFEPGDTRREGAFLWNYSGMNLGFFLGITLSGYLQLSESYHTLFFATSFSNIITILLTFANWSKFADRNTHLSAAPQSKQNKNILIGSGIIILLIPALNWLINHATFSNNLIMTAGVVMLVVLAGIAVKQPTSEARKKVWAFIILAISSLIFWTLYQLMPIGLTLFIERNVDRHLGTFIIPPQWFQNINSVIIIVGGPFLAWFFQKMRKKGYRITVPIQFSLALLLIGFAFVILPIGIKLANPAGYMSISWIVACFALQTVGELFISPIGYSMIGYLAPPRLQGLLMGTWMLGNGVAATVAGYFSQLAEGDTHSINPLLTNASYSHTFNLLGWLSVAVGVIVVVLIPTLHKLMNENKL